MQATRQAALAAAILATSGLGAGAVAAATNPEQVALQKTLKALMTKKYKQAAPKLKITTITCKLPSDGTVAHCVAHFTYPPTIVGTYQVKAELHDLGGTLTWTAGSPKCKDTKTGKSIAC